MTNNSELLDEKSADTGTNVVLREAIERAEKAEVKLAQLEEQQTVGPQGSQDGATARPVSEERHLEFEPGMEQAATGTVEEASAGVEELRKDSMMAHLVDSLEAGKDIGHYGRLVFAMIARHFLPEQEVLSLLTRDSDFSAEQARLMLRQVEGRDYNPPKRERILDWQAQQAFPILPDAEDPNCGNVYRNLKFPETVYEHIGHYQEERMDAES